MTCPTMAEYMRRIFRDKEWQTYLINHFICLVIFLLGKLDILGSIFSSSVEQLLKERILILGGFGAGGDLYAAFSFKLEGDRGEATAVEYLMSKIWR